MAVPGAEGGAGYLVRRVHQSMRQRLAAGRDAVLDVKSPLVQRLSSRPRGQLVDPLVTCATSPENTAAE